MKAKIFFLCLTLLQTSYILNSSGGGGSKTDTQADFLIQFAATRREALKRAEEKKAKKTVPPLWLAAQEGRSDVILQLIAAKARCDEKTGQASLHIATLNNHLDAVQTLVREGARIKRHDVIAATINDNQEVIEYFFDQDPKLINSSGILEDFEACATVVAAYHDNKDMFKLLLSHQPTIDEDSFIVMAEFCELKYIRELLDGNHFSRDADVLSRALFAAAQNSNPDGFLKYFLEKGVNPHDIDPETELSLFTFFGKPNEIRLLLDYKADPTELDNDGKTTIFGNINPESIRLLVMAKVGINVKNDSGETALSQAVSDHSLRKQNKLIDIINAYLENGADKTLQNDSGHSAYKTLFDARNYIQAESLKSKPGLFYSPERFKEALDNCDAALKLLADPAEAAAADDAPVRKQPRIEDQ